MITLIKEKQISKIIIILIILSYALPNFTSLDRIGNQWLYMSLINLFSFLYIYIKYSGDFSFTLFKESSILKWYLLYIISSLVSILYAENIPEAIITFNQMFNSFIGLYIMIYLLRKIKNPKDFIFNVLIFALLIELAFSFWPILNDIEKGAFKFRSMSYSGLSANINITAFSLVFKLPILIYFIIEKDKILQRFLLSILLYILLTTIFILGTRGAFLGIFSGIIFFIFYILLHIKYFRKNILAYSLITFSIAIAIITNLISSNNNKSADVLKRASTISLSTSDGSVNQRLRYYKQGVGHFISNPIIGLGIGNWKLKSIDYDKNNIFGYIVPYHAHNDFIQIAAEQGIFGLISYLMIFISFIFTIIKNKLFLKNSSYIFITACLVVFVIDSMLNFPISRPISQVQFILILSLISLKQIELKNEK
jgi:O-antigen ligase